MTVDEKLKKLREAVGQVVASYDPVMDGVNHEDMAVLIQEYAGNLCWDDGITVASKDLNTSQWEMLKRIRATYHDRDKDGIEKEGDYANDMKLTKLPGKGGWGGAFMMPVKLDWSDRIGNWHTLYVIVEEDGRIRDHG